MIWLLLSILFSAMLMLIFLGFKHFKINTLFAIVVNYLVCGLVGLYFAQDYSLQDYATEWLPYGILLGSLFIGIFFLIGITTQKMGVSVSTIAMKLGYIAPIILAFTYYGEQATMVKIVGIFLTIIAVVLSSLKQDKSNKEQHFDWKLFLLPITIFVGSGIGDSIVQLLSQKYFSNGGFEQFNVVLFFTAFAIGSCILTAQWFMGKKTTELPKNILAGITLGVPNYFSIYFLFKALNVPQWDDAFIFPINNVGIVILSSVLAVILFKEKLNTYNILGLILAVVSILVIGFL